MVIKISENIDMKNSLWIHGEEIDQIFSILKIPIKPEVSVNVLPISYEIHLDSDETKQWQFLLFVSVDFDIKGIVKGKKIKYQIESIGDSVISNNIGMIKQLMEMSQWSFKEKWGNQSITDNPKNDINVLTGFFKHLANALKGRIF